MTNRAEPPTLTAGEKTDPLLEIFSGGASGSAQAPKSLISPPPRFSEGLGANGTNPLGTNIAGATAPVAVRPSPRATEASAFTRSEMADQIRQSFDNLVKASPIGVPLMARRTPNCGPNPSPFPSLRSPAAPLFPPNSAGRLPLPPPVPSFGGFAFPRQQQQQQVQQVQQQPRTMLTPPLSGNNSGFIQQQQQQPPQRSAAIGLTGGGNTGGGGGNLISSSEPAAPAAAEGTTTLQEPPAREAAPSRRPSSAASQGTAKKVNRNSGGGTGTGRKRELASLLGSSPALHHNIGTTTTVGIGGMMANAPHLPATMPVSGGDRLPGADDDLTFEVTRFGRPRVAPLAYWSSERLVVGTKAAGAQGIDKGSASGDLLASGGGSTGKRKVKKKERKSVDGGTVGSGGSGAANKRKKDQDIEVTITAAAAVAADEEEDTQDELEAAITATRGGGRGRGRGRSAAGGGSARGGRRRGGRGRAGKVLGTAEAPREEEEEEEVPATSEDNEYAFPKEEETANGAGAGAGTTAGISSLTTNGGIASLAMAAGTKASITAAAAAKKKIKTAQTSAPPPPLPRPPQNNTTAATNENTTTPLRATPQPNINTTKTNISTDTLPPTTLLPVVKGVPESTIAALAATPIADRPKRCGKCISCLNPSRKQACQTMRALGGNPPLSRVSHKKKKQECGGGGAGDGSAMKEKEKEIGKMAVERNRKTSPSPTAAGPQDSDETLITEQHQQQQMKKKRTFRKRKADNSVDTNKATTAGTVRRSTRQRSASVELTVNNDGDDKHRKPSAALLDTATKGAPRGVSAGLGDADGPSSQRNVTTATAAAGKGAAVAGGAGGSIVPWTAEQVAALHRGWLEVAPNAKNFWQKVAAMVPGRSANECFNKMYEKHPTPPAAKKTAAGGGAGGGRKLLAAVRGGTTSAADEQHQNASEAIKIGGTSKQAVQNAARKIARQQRMRQRAEEVAAAGGGAAGVSSKEIIVEATEEQQHRDKYIDQILRKRRGRALGMAPHRASRPPSAAAGGGGFRSGASGVAREVTAALAAAREDEPDRDSGEESDYYWSDAE